MAQYSRLGDQSAENRSPMNIPLIEKIKIQARVLVPLVKALQAELGNARANAIVRNALGGLFRQYGETWWRKQGRSDLGQNMASAFAKFAAGNALDYDIVGHSPDTFDVNVTGCRYAKFFQELGEPELGFLLVCSADFRMAEGLGAGVELTRAKTIMQGAGHCDFRYTMKK